MSNAPDKEKDKSPDLTPAMIEAGSAELRDFVMADVGPALRQELAASVYEAMERARMNRALS